MASSLISHRNRVWFVILVIDMFVHVELNACGLDSLTVKQNLLATASNVDFTYTIPDKHVCVCGSHSLKECPKPTFIPTSLLPKLPPSSLWRYGRSKGLYQPLAGHSLFGGCMEPW